MAWSYRSTQKKQSILSPLIAAQPIEVGDAITVAWFWPEQRR